MKVWDPEAICAETGRPGSWVPGPIPPMVVLVMPISGGDWLLLGSYKTRAEALAAMETAPAGYHVWMGFRPDAANLPRLGNPR